MTVSKELAESRVFSGKLGEVVHVPQPDGRVFERFRRPPGVRMVIIADGRMLLTEEYRDETGGVDLRLPGGKVFDDYESFASARAAGSMTKAAEEAVLRESQEEVGLLVDSPELITVAQAGATVEWDLYYYLVEHFTEAADGAQPEAGEQIAPVWLTPQEVLNAIQRGRMSEWRSVGVLLGLVFPQQFPGSRG
ncbi:NUDIX hydrolase [Streptomyces sp. NPDC058685]|uniref:NUDIX hydrolase n=1 Tax=Streptomyces sp. NPDC058685 TaxID=3346598 RepID=UPI0036472F7D